MKIGKIDNRVVQRLAKRYLLDGSPGALCFFDHGVYPVNLIFAMPEELMKRGDVRLWLDWFPVMSLKDPYCAFHPRVPSGGEPDGTRVVFAEFNKSGKPITKRSCVWIIHSAHEALAKKLVCDIDDWLRALAIYDGVPANEVTVQ